MAKPDFAPRHSTATDALRGGLPLLTARGAEFPQRVGLSLQRAVLLLDAYVETDGEGGGAPAIRGALCSRRVRGRDRRRPFVYDPKSGQFDQAAQRPAEAELA